MPFINLRPVDMAAAVAAAAQCIVEDRRISHPLSPAVPIYPIWFPGHHFVTPPGRRRIQPSGGYLVSHPSLASHPFINHPLD